MNITEFDLSKVVKVLKNYNISKKGEQLLIDETYLASKILNKLTLPETKAECKCLTCAHIREIEKLIPDKALCHKVLSATDNLYEAMEDKIIDMERKIEGLKKEKEKFRQLSLKLDDAEYFYHKKIREITDD